MYSIPLIVDTSTEIKEVMAWRSGLFFMERMWSKNLKFYYWVILNMSLLISYSTKFLRSYGAICKALTLNDSNIYTIP